MQVDPIVVQALLMTLANHQEQKQTLQAVNGWHFPEKIDGKFFLSLLTPKQRKVPSRLASYAGLLGTLLSKI